MRMMVNEEEDISTNSSRLQPHELSIGNPEDLLVV